MNFPKYYGLTSRNQNFIVGYLVVLNRKGIPSLRSSGIPIVRMKFI